MKFLSKSAVAKTLMITGLACIPMLLTTSCDPAADHNLSSEEKVADMMWLYSIFGNNYAPLDYKEARYSFNFDKLKRTYLARAKRTKSNDEFYRLQQQFVAEFHDAHTSGSIQPANLPGQATIAYLGFSGVRDGKSFRVTKLMPTVDAASFPVKVDDVITEIDGMSVYDYIDKNLTPYRNLGNDLANKTMHMQNLFARLSLNLPIPEKDNVKLTIKRAPTSPKAPGEIRVELPWIKRDLYEFKIDQALIAASKDPSSKRLSVIDPGSHAPVDLQILDQRGIPMTVKDLLSYFERRRVNFADSFKLNIPSSISFTKSDAPDAPPPVGIEKLKTERNVPANAISIEEAKSYPAYFYTIDVKDANGKVRGKKRIGYIRIDSFEAPEDSAVGELKTTLRKFQANGVSDIIIDTIDNPGGSLSLLGKITQALSNKKLHLADMQIGLNDNWLSELQQASLTGSENTREISRRIYQILRKQKNEGKRLSTAFNMGDIVGQSDPNYEVNFKKIVVLTSEMNASCGDIFAAMIQDNEMGIVAGTDTMGAGGNVAQHSFDQAPNGHFTVRQTESLIVRKDGSYLENNGVTVDVPIDVNASRADKYSGVQKQAEAIILNKELTPGKLAEKRRAERSKAERSSERSPEASEDERMAQRRGELTGSDSTESKGEARSTEESRIEPIKVR